MHTRRLDDRVLHFGHRGWLWFNAFLLYDKETDSLWHHQSGRCLSGKLRGRALPRLPSAVMAYSAWLEEYPDTLVLPKPVDERPTDRDVYARRSVTRRHGLVVELPGAERLYPLHAFGYARLIEDTLAETPLVLAVHGPTRTGFAYDRRVEGAVLSFSLVTENGAGPRLKEEGGSRQWRLRTGVPVAGTGAVEPLRSVLATLWEVTAWRAQHPKVDVFTR